MTQHLTHLIKLRYVTSTLLLFFSLQAPLIAREGVPKKDNRLSTESARFYIQGGLHGNEVMTTELVRWMEVRYSLGISPLNKLNNERVVIDFVPVANPQGFRKRSRFNARGINLNRNFPVLWGLSRENPGRTSFSEPETRQIRRQLLAHNYIAAVDIHGYINWIVSPTAPERIPSKLRSSAKEAQYAAFLSSLRSITANLVGYELKSAGTLGDGGAFEDWAFWERGIDAFCLEMATALRHDEPQVLSSGKETSDRFLIYEDFIYQNFKAALERKIQANAVTAAL